MRHLTLGVWVNDGREIWGLQRYYLGPKRARDTSGGKAGEPEKVLLGSGSRTISRWTSRLPPVSFIRLHWGPSVWL